MSGDLEDRLDSLEARFESYRDDVVRPGLSELRQDRDDARDERAELRAEVDHLRQKTAHLESRIESIAGLEEDEMSTPEKRARDIRQALYRRADARGDDYQGYASMYYKEVEDALADLGHGSLARTQLLRSMRDAAEAPGFDMGSKTSRHGNDVEAILLDMDELPADAPCNNVTTRDGASGARNGGETADESTAD